MRPDELEPLVARKLADLPVPRAPETLLPRVMAAVAEWTARPWNTRAWLTWPLSLQIASAAALLLFVGAAAFGMTHAALRPAALMTSAAEQVRAAGAAAQTAAAAFEALWRGLVRPVAPYALAIVSMMCAACAACGAALNQIVMGRTAQR
jgi:hypothetical protein